MLLALIAQVFSVYDNRKNNMIKWSKGIIDACLHAIRDVYLSDPHYTEKVTICCMDAGNWRISRCSQITGMRSM